MTDKECEKHAEEFGNKAMAEAMAGMDERQAIIATHWAAGLAGLAIVLMKEERADGGDRLKTLSAMIASFEITLAGLKEQRRIIVDGEE